MQIKSASIENTTVQAIGFICGTIGEALSCAIYSSAEAKVDAARLNGQKEEEK